ncbi:hypothetical protein CBS14141_001137 [Malassezia furfur]|nr:hypothetical protein CBS14141_001137 [Malassezia furfur]
MRAPLLPQLLAAERVTEHTHTSPEAAVPPRPTSSRMSTNPFLRQVPSGLSDGAEKRPISVATVSTRPDSAAFSDYQLFQEAVSQLSYNESPPIEVVRPRFDTPFSEPSTPRGSDEAALPPAAVEEPTPTAQVDETPTQRTARRSRCRRRRRATPRAPSGAPDDTPRSMPGELGAAEPSPSMRSSDMSDVVWSRMIAPRQHGAERGQRRGMQPQRSLVPPFELQNRSLVLPPGGDPNRPGQPPCLECMMRDEDMVDVYVTDPAVWERESDADFYDAIRAEHEERLGGDGRRSPWTMRLTRVHVTKVAVGDPLSAANLKGHTQQLRMSSAQRARVIQAFVTEQRILLGLEAPAPTPRVPPTASTSSPPTPAKPQSPSPRPRRPSPPRPPPPSRPPPRPCLRVLRRPSLRRCP